LNSNQPVIYEEGQLNYPFNNCKQHFEEIYGYYGEYEQIGKNWRRKVKRPFVLSR